MFIFQDVVKKPQYFASAQPTKTSVTKKETTSKGKQDRKEERKNKRQSG